MNIARAVTLAVSAVGLIACASSSDAESPPPPPTLGVQYATQDLSSPFETIEFEENGRYVGEWRPCGNATCNLAKEEGAYEIRGAQIVFIDDATHASRTMPYAAPTKTDETSKLTKSLAPLDQDLTNGASQPVSGSQQPVSGSSQAVSSSSTAVQSNMQLVDKQYALVLCGGGAGICSYIGCPGNRTNLGPAKPGECLGGATGCCSLTISG